MNEVLLQMDDVVVTSMRNSYLLRDVPINTEVIGKKEIKESGVLTVSGLLDQLWYGYTLLVYANQNVYSWSMSFQHTPFIKFNF